MDKTLERMIDKKVDKVKKVIDLDESYKLMLELGIISESERK